MYAPGRIAHTAVWTGNEMIVWGGVDETSACVTNDGGRYDPSADSWIADHHRRRTLAPDRHTLRCGQAAR